MHIVLFTLFALGCHSIGGIAPADTGVPESDANTDTDGDTDADADADADADSDPSYDGHYAGDVWVVIEQEWWTEEAAGEFGLEVRSHGGSEGWATVSGSSHGGWDVQGDITGDVSDGVFEGVWMVRLWEDEAKRIDIEGQIVGERIHVDFEHRADWMFVYGAMDGERID